MRPKTALVLFLALTTTPVIAQDRAAEPDSTAAARLTEISASLARIADLLEAQAERGRLELVMRRIELRQRRLSPLESRLREARANRDGYREKKLRLESEVEAMEERLAAGTVDPGEIQVTTDYLASELAVVTNRLAALEEEIGVLEGEVSRYSREIEDWEVWVDRELR